MNYLLFHLFFSSQDPWSLVKMVKINFGSNFLILREEFLEKEVDEPVNELICHICGSNFKTLKLLRKHQDIHQEDVSLCNLCEKTFTNKVKLKDHKRYVHSNSSYECQECKKTYSNPQNLKIHQKIHPM